MMTVIYRHHIIEIEKQGNMITSTILTRNRCIAALDFFTKKEAEIESKKLIDLRMRG